VATLIVLIRWFHAVAAVAWVGGMLFYVAVLNPALKKLDAETPRGALLAGIARQFQELTQAAIAVVLLTGAVLTFDRLSQPHVVRPYVVVLAVKIVLSVLMVALAGGLGRRTVARRRPIARRRRRWFSVPYLILALGLLVYLLAVILQVLFDTSYGAVS
jgi:uncharacterized membrane protein